MLVFSFLLIARLSCVSAAMCPFFLYVPLFQVVFSAAFLLVLPWGSHEFILVMSGARIIPHKHGILFLDHHICYIKKLEEMTSDDRRNLGLQFYFLTAVCEAPFHQYLYFWPVCSVKQLGIMTYQGDLFVLKSLNINICRLKQRSHIHLCGFQ